MAELNKKQQSFCIEYIKDFNGKQAAIRAGYSKKTAEVQASQILRILKVQDFIKDLIKPNEEEAKKEFQDWKQRQLSRATASLLDYVDIGLGGMVIRDLSGLTDLQKQAIKKVTYNPMLGGWIPELHDPQKADVELAKAMGWYKEDPKDVNISGQIEFKPTKIIIEKD